MSVTLLLDPGILVPPATPPAAWRDFWTRLLDWSTDGRAKLGRESYTYVWDRYAEIGYPHQELELHPPELEREYRKAIDRLLSSVATAAPRQVDIQFDAEYAGPPGAEAALRRDIPIGPTALATAQGMWRHAPAQLCCEPPPPASIQVVVRPNALLGEEKAARAREWMAGRRIRIVGGQRDPRLVKAISDALGVESQEIDWLPCERHKKPPIARSWANLHRDRDVALCITGRVGHTTSDAAARLAQAAGAPYIKVTTANEILAGLVDLATRQ